MRDHIAGVLLVMVLIVIPLVACVVLGVVR
jgi:hypothetical protein